MEGLNKYSGDLNSEYLNNKLIWIANFYLFGIQTVAKWMVLTIQLATMVKGSEVTKLFNIQIVTY